jgi:tetratricopeptide (TPR) repeat protein
MYGLWCLLGLIILSGMLGGFIFTLNSQYSHSFRVPFVKNEIDSGFLGHIIIGIGGSIVAVGFSIPVFNLDLSIFEQTWSETNPPHSLIPISLYVLAIGVLGGFSGLRIIASLSDAMLKKLKEEIESNKVETEKEIGVLRTSVAKNYIEDRKRENDLKSAQAQTLMLEGNFLIYSGRPDEGVRKLKSYLNENSKNAKAWSWLAMGYKRMGMFNEAITAVNKAIELDSNEWRYYYNLACYNCLNQNNVQIRAVTNVKTFTDIFEKVFSLASSTEAKKEVLKGLDEDDDFASIRHEQDFHDFLERFK